MPTLRPRAQARDQPSVRPVAAAPPARQRRRRAFSMAASMTAGCLPAMRAAIAAGDDRPPSMGMAGSKRSPQSCVRPPTTGTPERRRDALPPASKRGPRRRPTWWRRCRRARPSPAGGARARRPVRDAEQGAVRTVAASDRGSRRPPRAWGRRAALPQSRSTSCQRGGCRRNTIRSHLDHETAARRERRRRCGAGRRAVEGPRRRRHDRPGAGGHPTARPCPQGAPESRGFSPRRLHP